MKVLLAVIACVAVVCEARFRNPDLDSWDYPMFEDPQGGGCQFDCNSARNGGTCVNGVCSCNKGFGGSYCTCEELCRDPFGSCDNDQAGTCTCTPNAWKGRNCNCPYTCPETNNWACKTGDTLAERGCYCKLDMQDWTAQKPCCDTTKCKGAAVCVGQTGDCKCESTGHVVKYGSPAADYTTCCNKYCKPPMQCKDNGDCYCPHTGVTIPYTETDPSKYVCCQDWCKDDCECTTGGCKIKVTGQIATSADMCKPPAPPSGPCKTHGSWEECSIVHWQGKCVCEGATCSCKCWYGWAGGQGVFRGPGYDAGYKALYAEHCRNRCDWTHDYQPGYCGTCEEVDCPECSPNGAKKCKGTA